MERNASAYQVYSVSCISDEGRAEFIRAWEHAFVQRVARGGGGGVNDSDVMDG